MDFKNKERVIQKDNNNGLYALTNYGRIFLFSEDINNCRWIEIEGLLGLKEADGK